MIEQIKDTNGSNAHKDALQPESVQQLSPDIGPPKTWPIVVTGLTLSAVAIGGVYTIVRVASVFNEIGAMATFITVSIVGLFTLLAIVAQAAIYWQQRNFMMRQWKATQDSVNRTDTIIEKMQLQLEAMNDQARHAESQVTIMRDTLEQTKRVFNLTERPVVIVLKAEIEGVFASNKPLRPKIVFANKGRTAAQHFNITTEIAGKKGHVWMWGFGDTGVQPSGDMFLPANSDPQALIGAPASAVTLDDAFYTDVCNGREQFFIHGRGSYQDLAGQEYSIEYAFRFHPAYGFVSHSMAEWVDHESEDDQNPN